MRKPDFTRRVAVTGLGIVSPVGSDIPTAWSNLVAGNSGLRVITYWDPTATDCHAAGEVHDFDPNVWMDFKAVRRTDKNVVLSHKAAIDAHLAEVGIPVSYTNVFWGGRSEIKPSEIAPKAYEEWCRSQGVDPATMKD